jgi:hypothetical protein
VVGASLRRRRPSRRGLTTAGGRRTCSTNKLLSPSCTRACVQSLENSSPQDDRRDQPHGLVVGGALFVVRRQSAAWLAAIHEALDPVAETGERASERPRAPVVPLARDGDPAAMLARLAPNPPTAVALVPADAGRTTLGTAWPSPLDGTALQERCKDHGLVWWPRGQEDGPQLAAPVSAQMDCGTETAPAAAAGVRRWSPVWAPAACGGARSIVPSRSCRSPFSWPWASAWAGTAAKSGAQLPARCQRSKRRATVRHGPSRAGRSRPGAPGRSIQSLPVRMRR